MRGKLDALLSLAEDTHCRRASLLAYFGEQMGSGRSDGAASQGGDPEPSNTLMTGRAHDDRDEEGLFKQGPRNRLRRAAGAAAPSGGSEPHEVGSVGAMCMNCDNCLNPPAVWDATDAARKMLSCIYRVQQASGISFGAGHIMDILRGKTSEKMTQFSHDKLSTFGIGADLSEAQWRAVMRQLIAKNMVRVNTEAFSTLELLPAARQVLRGETSLLLREQLAQAGTSRSKRNTKTSVKGLAEAALNAGALERLARLKTWRAEIAREHNLPAFVIFHDSTLRAIAERAPQSLQDLEGVAGIGLKKLEAYGAEVLRVCAAVD
jgi:ATP-dependent DNA helicase RecQ